MVRDKRKTVPDVAPGHSYSYAQSSAERELQELKIRRDAIKKEASLVDTRIEKLEEMLRALATLCEDEAGNASVGLTEACRMVLSAMEEDGFGGKKRVFLTVPEIRKRIEALGARLGSYKNVLAVLHSTLNRMVAQGEVETGKGKSGQPTFWMKR